MNPLTVEMDSTVGDLHFKVFLGSFPILHNHVDVHESITVVWKCESFVFISKASLLLLFFHIISRKILRTPTDF